MGEAKNVNGISHLNVWWDAESDFLEVSWGKTYDTQETEDDRAMIKLDQDGNVVGFSILGLSDAKPSPLNLRLVPLPEEAYQAVSED
jgi:uncharacterized protein YuzE